MFCLVTCSDLHFAQFLLIPDVREGSLNSFIDLICWHLEHFLKLPFVNLFLVALLRPVPLKASCFFLTLQLLQKRANPLFNEGSEKSELFLSFLHFGHSFNVPFLRSPIALWIVDMNGFIPCFFFLQFVAFSGLE